MPHPNTSPVPVDFQNTAVAFQAINNNTLRQSALLFSTMHYPWLVKYGQNLIKGCLRIGLPVKWLLKKTIFNHFCGGESIEDSTHTAQRLASSRIGTILDYSVEGAHTNEAFEHTTQEILHTIDAAQKNPYRPFCVFKVTGVAEIPLLEKLSAQQTLSAEEHKAYTLVQQRIETLCAHAHQAQVPLFIDAEESWIQPAIDVLCENMMLKFNTAKPIVFTTLQMYRHDRLAYLQKLQLWAQEKKCFVGVKLVRGAYMEKERERALAMGYPSPIQPNKESTDNDYNKALNICLKNLDVFAVCVATHNEESAQHALKELQTRGLPHNHPHVFFAQLFGMSDHITYNLAHHGYNTAKYVPYGPVEAVLPYLFRRAEENTSIQGQTGRELTLIKKELSRRAHT